MCASLIQKWEDISYAPKAASTEFNVGYFISYDGLGGVIPAQSASLYGQATKILGVILTPIASSDDDYADETMVPFQVALGNTFVCSVSGGSATASDIGSTFDVDGTNPANIDISAPGTQLQIVRVLSADSVLVKASEVEPIA